VNQAPNNPEGNKLGPSINEPNLISAIELSGYPLQGIVAEKLNSEFGVTEEWGYIDRDTQEHRSLDLFAFKMLLTDGDVQPFLVLLIECKRSINPYVFFKNVVDRAIPSFPRISGLPQNCLWIQEPKGKRTRITSGTNILGLEELPFIRPGPPHCSAFSMAVAKGKKIILSGLEPFNTLILPLVKAIDHAMSLYEGSSNPILLHPTLILSLSVLDAPMLVVHKPSQASTPVLTPWVRIPRQEAHSDGIRLNYVHYVADIVHIDFFDEFLSNHLMPFVNDFVSRTQEQSAVLFKGGVVPNLDNWKWDEIQPRRN
jgi:hypothetical protein